MTSTRLTKQMALAWALVAPMALAGLLWADERPRTSSAVQVRAQGGSGTGAEPASGAPPAVAPSLSTRPAQAQSPATPSGGPAVATALSLRAVALGDGEATLEIAGRREVVRPGSRVGDDTVRSVTPERIVLERAPAPDEKGPSLVILTFDESGRGRTRVFSALDATRPVEVKRP